MFLVHCCELNFSSAPLSSHLGTQGEQAAHIYDMSFCGIEKEQERWWKHAMLLRAAGEMRHISCLLTFFGQNKNQAMSKVNNGGDVKHSQGNTAPHMVTGRNM